MPTQVGLSDDGRYVLVTQEGPIIISQIKQARTDSLPLYMSNVDRALVDLRQADISALSLIDLDDLGITFKQDVPKCKRMAIVKLPAVDDDRYVHLANAHRIRGVATELFECMEAAKDWLLNEI